MKKLLLPPLLMLLASFNSLAQLTGISPNQGTVGQTLQTTITANGIFLQSGSPSGNLFSVKLIKGLDVFTMFDFWNQWQYPNVSVMSQDSISAEAAIPMGQAPGVYDLEVIVGDQFYPPNNQVTWTLPSAFTIAPPDGYITGNVYLDDNRNGLKDAGEPGLANKLVRLLPSMTQVLTDANGNYSLAVMNGNYSVVFYTNAIDYYFVYSPNDTIPVTINNGNSPGNDFGINTAMVSITPNIAFKGLITSHQIVADRPIFIPGGPPNGNVTQFRIYSSPIINLNAGTSVTVIDSFTIHVNISIPVNTVAANNLDIRIYTSSGTVAYHYLKQQLDIVVPPVTISGTAFYDANQNKIYDVTEPGLPNAKVILTPDGSIGFSDAQGDFSVGSLGGMQTLTYDNNLPGLVLFTDSASYTFNAVGIITGKDFGFLSTAPDYSILAKDPYVFPRCQTVQPVSFKVKNISNIAYDGVAWLKFDPAMTFDSSGIPYTISNDTIYWNFTNLQPYTQQVFTGYFMMPPPFDTLQIIAGAWSEDVNNVIQFTDEQLLSTIVRCAFDPNDKSVTPPGIFAQNFTLMSDTLEYLVRFQNTGNDTAFTVYVLDTLDSNLDRNTFEVLGSSHSMLTEVESNNAVRFQFNNIMLPDSNVNEPESHGYILYRVKAQAGLADSTVVNNTAYIYFDFNPAVVTNTTLNTLVFVLPVGMDEIEGTNDHVIVYPNPFEQSATFLFDNPSSDKHVLSVFDITGKKAMPDLRTTGNMIVIERNKLTSGVYFYRVKNVSTGKIYSGKLVVN